MYQTLKTLFVNMTLTDIPLIETIILVVSNLTILGRHRHCMIIQILLYKMKILLINSILHIMNHTGQVTQMFTSIDHYMKKTTDNLKVVTILT